MQLRPTGRALVNHLVSSTAELKLQNQRHVERRDNNVHQRARLEGRIVRVWTANAPSVPRLLIFPLKAAHRRDTASLFHCLLPRGHSRACLPIGKSPPLGPGAALMTESRSLPCSAPLHQSRGAAERHSPHATRSRLSRPSVDDKRALESDIHPPASGETNVLTDAAVLMRKPLRLLAAVRRWKWRRGCAPVGGQ